MSKITDFLQQTYQRVGKDVRDFGYGVKAYVHESQTQSRNERIQQQALSLANEHSPEQIIDLLREQVGKEDLSSLNQTIALMQAMKIQTGSYALLGSAPLESTDHSEDKTLLADELINMGANMISSARNQFTAEQEQANHIMGIAGNAIAQAKGISMTEFIHSKQQE